MAQLFESRKFGLLPPWRSTRSPFGDPKPPLDGRGCRKTHLRSSGAAERLIWRPIGAERLPEASPRPTTAILLGPSEAADRLTSDCPGLQKGSSGPSAAAERLTSNLPGLQKDSSETLWRCPQIYRCARCSQAG